MFEDSYQQVPIRREQDFPLETSPVPLQFRAKFRASLPESHYIVMPVFSVPTITDKEYSRARAEYAADTKASTVSLEDLVNSPAFSFEDPLYRERLPPEQYKIDSELSTAILAKKERNYSLTRKMPLYDLLPEFWAFSTRQRRGAPKTLTPIVRQPAILERKRVLATELMVAKNLSAGASDFAKQGGGTDFVLLSEFKKHLKRLKASVDSLDEEFTESNVQYDVLTSKLPVLYNVPDRAVRLFYLIHETNSKVLYRTTTLVLGEVGSFVLDAQQDYHTAQKSGGVSLQHVQDGTTVRPVWYRGMLERFSGAIKNVNDSLLFRGSWDKVEEPQKTTVHDGAGGPLYPLNVYAFFSKTSGLVWKSPDGGEAREVSVSVAILRSDVSDLVMAHAPYASLSEAPTATATATEQGLLNTTAQNILLTSILSNAIYLLNSHDKTLTPYEMNLYQFLYKTESGADVTEGYLSLERRRRGFTLYPPTAAGDEAEAEAEAKAKGKGKGKGKKKKARGITEEDQVLTGYEKDLVKVEAFLDKVKSSYDEMVADENDENVPTYEQIVQMSILGHRGTEELFRVVFDNTARKIYTKTESTKLLASASVYMATCRPLLKRRPNENNYGTGPLITEDKGIEISSARGTLRKAFKRGQLYLVEMNNKHGLIYVREVTDTALILEGASLIQILKQKDLKSGTVIEFALQEDWEIVDRDSKDYLLVDVGFKYKGDLVRINDKIIKTIVATDRHEWLAAAKDLWTKSPLNYRFTTVKSIKEVTIVGADERINISRNRNVLEPVSRDEFNMLFERRRKASLQDHGHPQEQDKQTE